jgi:hypothetical protein
MENLFHLLGPIRSGSQMMEKKVARIPAQPDVMNFYTILYFSTYGSKKIY